MALRCFWEIFRDLAFVLWPLRMIVLPLAVCLAALLALPQAQEILVKIGQDNDPADWAFFGIAALWLAFNAWFWGRFITGFVDDLRPPIERCGSPECGGKPFFGGQAKRIAFLTAHLPRVLGFVVLAGIAAALLIASSVLPQTDADARRRLITAAVFAGVGAFVLYAVAYFRRPATRRLGDVKWIPRPVARRLDIPKEPPRLHSFRDLGWVLGFSAAISLALFFASSVAPVWTGMGLGPAAILFLAATAWIAVGTLLVYACQSTGLPIIGTIALVAYLSSLVPDSGIFHDNHDVRTLAAAPASRIGPDAKLIASFDAWDKKPRPDAKAPIVIVATAGGGIRAAYWTATVLGELSDRSQKNAAASVSEGAPRPLSFASQLFAISGVSGGSLGAAVYRALLLEWAQGHRTCSADGAAEGSFARCGQAALSADFLGPAVAATLFPDLVQRLVPVSILPDRAAALEKAWEAGWRQAIGDDRFAQDFLSDGAGGIALPALLLNGTSVSSGRRLLTSTLPLTIPGENGNTSALPGATDFLAASGMTVRLSTAVDNSARFSWLGPAGTIRQAEGSIVDRVVDGGYFENFGATTAIDLIRALEGKLANKNAPHLITILISSDPDLDSPDRTDCEKKTPLPRYDNDRGGEVLTPVVTLMHTREARGAYAADELETLTHDVGGKFFHFRLLKQTDIHDAPLGWTLSRRAQQAIQETWSGGCQNSRQMADLAKLLNWTR